MEAIKNKRIEMKTVLARYYFCHFPATLMKRQKLVKRGGCPLIIL